jgi:hypothetical protein
MLPTGKFTIHTHPTLHDTAILCTPDVRAVTTLSGPRTGHLFLLSASTSHTAHSKKRPTTSSHD